MKTAAQVSAWIDDETESMTAGWIPLTSELQPDGSLRVLYGRLPDELQGERLAVITPQADGSSRIGHPSNGPSETAGGRDAAWGPARTAVVMVAVVLFLATFAVFARML